MSDREFFNLLDAYLPETKGRISNYHSEKSHFDQFLLK